MRKLRRAKLTVEEPIHASVFGSDKWLRLTHRNGEIAMMGEGVKNPTRARAATIRSMVDVVTGDDAGLQLVVSRLREMGYTVEEDICPKCADEAVEEAGR